MKTLVRDIDPLVRKTAEENGALIRFENGEEAVDAMFLKGLIAGCARSANLANRLRAQGCSDEVFAARARKALEDFGAC